MAKGGKDTTASFTLALQDGITDSSQDAAAALVKLKKAIADDTAELRAMQSAMRQLKGVNEASAAFAKLKDQVLAQKRAIAQSQAKFVDLGGSFKKSAGDAKAAGSKYDELLLTVERMPGPLGGLVSKFKEFSALVGGSAIALGIAAIAAAVVALTAAVAVATAALFKYGLAQSDARRSELLHLEGLTTIRRWYGLSAGSATELQSAIDRVSDSSALGRGEISRYAEQLHRMGLRGQDLSDALEGVSIVGSVQGDRWAHRFAGMTAAAVRTGHSVRALTDDVRARLGGIATRQALGFNVQIDRLHRSIGRIFDGLKIDKLLEGLHEVLSLFSQSTFSGRALKVIFETLFQPLVDGVAKTAPIAKRFFQGMVIGALLVTIGLQRVRAWLDKTFGDSEILSGINAQKAAVYTGIAVLVAFAAAAGLAALAVGSLALTLLVLAAPILLGVAAIGALIYAGAKLVQWYRDQDWSRVGRELTEGIVDGVKAGGRAVVDAIKGLATSAHDALTSALGIHSPSRVFAALGRQIPAGIALGVEENAGAAQGAVDAAAPRATLDGAAAGGRAGNSVSIGELHIHTGAPGTEGASIAADFVETLRELLQGHVIEEEIPA